MPARQFGACYQVSEWEFEAQVEHGDPFNSVTLDAVFRDEAGSSWTVPGFWAGGRRWRVRFAPPSPGAYSFETVCSHVQDPGLHGVAGSLQAWADGGNENPLFRHGPIRVAPSRRHFEHADGKPFLWLADTWWMGLCSRLRWPEEFQVLTADRLAKGFSVVQIVAGLYPDMPAFDERGKNEGGFPWEPEFTRVNPAYFDMADLRIRWLAQSGLVPCIVGCWGYYLPLLGLEKMKRHWRHLVARWGAYPVVWCLAGEGTMPYYLSEQREEDSAFQKRGWTEMGGYVRSIDPFHRPVTIHPSASGRDTVEDDSVLDFDMLQTGHGDRTSLPNTVQQVARSRSREPHMPVINGEVCYEGIGEACRQEVQRMMFWASVLTGACGHTYGANGIWQVNQRAKPYGPSPHGMAWGHTPWEDAARLPGSAQLGLARKLLDRYPWWQFEPHPEWMEPHWSAEDYFLPYAAGIPGQVRVYYWPLMWQCPRVAKVEPDVPYQAFLFNPADGSEHHLGPVIADGDGRWDLPIRRVPIYQDWVMVLDATGARAL